MRVNLRDLKNNPFRDFRIDPVDAESVKAIKDSIKEDGFWGGVVCRKKDGEIQIGAGHHRVKAAIQAGIDAADVFIGSIDDAGMIRVYARENATQRGNTSTALAGTVASAVKFLTKNIILGGPGNFTRASELPNLRRDLANPNGGVGRDLIVRFLKDTPGINENVVRQQLVNLKTSGEIARIVKEVKKEIERESDDEEIISLAKRVDDAASDRPQTFDFEGVARHLRNDNQVRVFREWATQPGVANRLPVNQQANLAQRIVREARDQDSEVSGNFIRTNAGDLLTEATRRSNRQSREEQRAAREENIREKFEYHREMFERNWRGAASQLLKMQGLIEANPNVEFEVGEFVSTINSVIRTSESILRVMRRVR
jgi:hypothetical protein